jgi:cholesterol oxidase
MSGQARPCGKAHSTQVGVGDASLSGRHLLGHFIGGCTIGDSEDSGVVDAYQRVYNYPGLHIADGSAISANLGVNPVAHDHRAGGAGDVVLAEQGRGRHPPGSRRPVCPDLPSRPRAYAYAFADTIMEESDGGAG